MYFIPAKSGRNICIDDRMYPELLPYSYSLDSLSLYKGYNVLLQSSLCKGQKWHVCSTVSDSQFKRKSKLSLTTSCKFC